MIWTSLKEHPKVIKKGEDEGCCPGCGRETTTFASILIPDYDPIGVYCLHCIDGETIERLDPRQSAAMIKQALIQSDMRWKLGRP